MELSNNNSKKISDWYKSKFISPPFKFNTNKLTFDLLILFFVINVFGNTDPNTPIELRSRLLIMMIFNWIAVGQIPFFQTVFIHFRNKRKYKPVGTDLISEYALKRVENLSKNFHKLPQNLQVLVSRDNTPHTVEGLFNKALLIIPEHFIVGAKRQPKIFDAAISHELGHLYQKDTNIWHDKHLLLTGYCFLGANLLSCSFLMNSYAQYGESINLSRFFVFTFLVIHKGLPIISKYQKKRLLSETNADLGAIAITKNFTMLEILYERALIDNSQNQSQNHPTIIRRYNLLLKKLETIGLEVPQHFKPITEMST